MRLRLKLFLMAGLVWLCPADVSASQNMIGRQSQNEGMLAVPAPGPVTVDGSLEDWDFSGRIWAFVDLEVRNRYSAETAAMWTEEALYIGVRWHDPTPLFNMVDPKFNVNDGWKSDSLQMRINTSDQTQWLTAWYFTPQKQPTLHIAKWKDRSNSRNGIEESFMTTIGGTKLERGVEMAYRVLPDGKGYEQEIKLPWPILFKTAPKIEAGLTLQIGFEYFWGDPTGQTWPVHRYADNMQQGATSREFFWTSVKSWGDVKLVAQGKVPTRQYISDEGKIEGTVPVRVTIPKSAARFTVAINDANGKRIRNLGGDLMPEDYTVSSDKDTRTVEVMWDLLDDRQRLVGAGSYEVIGLTHGGLGAEYEMCFYNPGTPPWAVESGSGAWGADHTAPLRVARGGDWMIASWGFAEGGSGIIGIGPDGKKKWGEKRGAQYLAADDEYVYAVPSGWHIDKDVLIRLKKKTGAYAQFEKDGKPMPFEIPIKDILQSDNYSAVGLLGAGEHIVVLLQTKTAAKPGESDHDEQGAPVPANLAGKEGALAFIDKKTAGLAKLVKIPPMTGVAQSASGDIFGIDGRGAFKIDLASGKAAPIAADGLAKPVAIAVDLQGNLVIADAGEDMQVKAFSPDGKLAYTCGRKGSRPIRGKFDPQSMRAMSSVAVDASGQVWVVESWNFPRRISIWNPKDGTLVKDYVGNTGYSAGGSFLHDSDPEIAYVGPIEIKLNKATRSWNVSQVIWVADASKGECFDIASDGQAKQRFSATVNGKKREYYFSAPYRDYEGYVIYMERENGWYPVSAVTTVGRISGKFAHNGAVAVPPSGEFADCNAYDGVFWNDQNKDGKVQRNECEIVKTQLPGNEKKRGTGGVPLGSGWGERIGTDFAFYVRGIQKIAPVSFTEDGAPVYSSKSVSLLVADDINEMVPVLEDNLLVGIHTSGSKDPRVAGFDTKTGALKWEYPNPYPGVHGSHKATMPKAGMVIGPLKICGVADVNADAGKVFLVRGNLGQDFFLTTDGLYVGAMFQDGRLPNEKMPAKEEQLVGVPMETFSHGSEPFNGWFGKQADGKIRMTTGFPGQAGMILSVNGLENIKKFKGGKFEIKEADIATADRANQERAIKSSPPAEYTVKRTDAPKIDGAGNDWNDIASVEISRKGFPFKGTAKLRCDDKNLYLLYAIEDLSPWLNEGKDFTRLFKTGDAVDLQLSTNPQSTADAKRRDLNAGDVRVVIADVNKKPAAVLMRAIDKSSTPEKAVNYQSPVGNKNFDRVEIIASAQVVVKKGNGNYTVEAAIPLSALGLTVEKGTKLRGDIGFISSDQQGSINVARTYWANKDTNLVSDLPQEAWMNPAGWGVLIFE